MGDVLVVGGAYSSEGREIEIVVPHGADPGDQLEFELLGLRAKSATIPEPEPEQEHVAPARPLAHGQSPQCCVAVTKDENGGSLGLQLADEGGNCVIAEVIDRDGPAARAGLGAYLGWIVTHVAEQPCHTAVEARNILMASASSKQVVLALAHSNSTVADIHPYAPEPRANATVESVVADFRGLDETQKAAVLMQLIK